ncbi:MAG: hypothetical protein JST68_00460 [Bacteroidetes bacterium]|nr:hypothetical protein [Bacteroidota bacterium]
MRNLVRFDSPPIEFHDAVVSRKQDEALRQILTNIRPSVEEAFNNYSVNSLVNSLETLAPNAECYAQRNSFLELYSYGSKMISEFKNVIQNLQSLSIRYICQYCTLTQHTSFDHILPGSVFPEFVVHPWNLFPSCEHCNGKKSIAWVNGGMRQTLNLYLDILPEEQYLFVNIIPDPTAGLDFEYYLQNANHIDNNMFNLIASHYVRLDLLNRLKKESIGIFTEIITSVRANLISMSLPDALATLAISAEDFKRTRGDNYWKAVLLDTLSTNIEFSNFVSQF